LPKVQFGAHGNKGPGIGCNKQRKEASWTPQKDLIIRGIEEVDQEEEKEKNPKPSGCAPEGEKMFVWEKKKKRSTGTAILTQGWGRKKGRKRVDRVRVTGQTIGSVAQTRESPQCSTQENARRSRNRTPQAGSNSKPQVLKRKRRKKTKHRLVNWKVKEEKKIQKKVVMMKPQQAKIRPKKKKMETEKKKKATKTTHHPGPQKNRWKKVRFRKGGKNQIAPRKIVRTKSPPVRS